MQNKKAFILIELITALFLSGIITLISFQAINLSKHVTKTYSEKLSQEKTFQKLIAYTNRAIDSLDKHTLEIYPIVHEKGKISSLSNKNITFTNNTPNNDSNALSFLELDIDKALRIFSLKLIGDYLEFYACSNFKTKLHLENRRSYLGITPNSNVELEFVSIKSGSINHCRTLTLKTIDKMPNSLLTNMSIKMLIPIKSNLTIYLNEKNELRLLSLLGPTVLENQPLGGKGEKLEFNHSISNDLNLYTLNFKATFKNRIFREYKITNTISREKNIYFLMQTY